MNYYALYIAVAVTVGMVAGFLVAKDELHEGISLAEVLFILYTHVAGGAVVGLFLPVVVAIVALYNIKVIEGRLVYTSDVKFRNWKEGVQGWLRSLGGGVL